MLSRFTHAVSSKNNAVQSFYSQYKTLFTVATTLVGTSAAWASYYARSKHNQKLEKNIEEINQSIAAIPGKTNNLYDRMDMIILGCSALIVGYMSCAVKHRTINYYRYWNVRNATIKSPKLMTEKKGINDIAVSSGLVSKEDIKTLEKSENHLLRYYYQSFSQSFLAFGSSIVETTGRVMSKCTSAVKAAVLGNQQLILFTKTIYTRVSTISNKLTSRVTVVYDNLVYKYNLRLIEKKHAKIILDGEKEVVNKANMSSVL